MYLFWLFFPSSVCGPCYPEGFGCIWIFLSIFPSLSLPPFFLPFSICSKTYSSPRPSVSAIVTGCKKRFNNATDTLQQAYSLTDCVIHDIVHRLCWTLPFNLMNYSLIMKQPPSPLYCLFDTRQGNNCCCPRWSRNDWSNRRCLINMANLALEHFLGGGNGRHTMRRTLTPVQHSYPDSRLVRFRRPKLIG